MIIACGDTWALDAQGAFRTLIANDRKLKFKLDTEKIYLFKNGKPHSISISRLDTILSDFISDTDELEAVLIALL